VAKEMLALRDKPGDAPKSKSQLALEDDKENEDPGEPGEPPEKKRKRAMSAYELFKIDHRAEVRIDLGRPIDIRETWVTTQARKIWDEMPRTDPVRYAGYLRKSELSKGEATYHKAMERIEKRQSEPLALKDGDVARQPLGVLLGPDAPQHQLALALPSAGLGLPAAMSSAIVPVAAAAEAPCVPRTGHDLVALMSDSSELQVGHFAPRVAPKRANRKFPA